MFILSTKKSSKQIKSSSYHRLRLSKSKRKSPNVTRMKRPKFLRKFPGPHTSLRVFLSLLSLLKVKISNLVYKTKHSLKQHRLLFSDSRRAKIFSSWTQARKELSLNRKMGLGFKNQAWRGLCQSKRQVLGFKNQAWRHQWPSRSQMHLYSSNQLTVFSPYKNKTKTFSRLIPLLTKSRWWRAENEALWAQRLNTQMTISSISCLCRNRKLWWANNRFRIRRICLNILKRTHSCGNIQRLQWQELMHWIQKISFRCIKNLRWSKICNWKMLRAMTSVIISKT